ncbi:Ras-related protein Rab-6A [Nematocida sp. AWRm77]|nr:Ras-related protein Rab-6A [Nematocida sp. AWRm77]
MLKQTKRELLPKYKIVFLGETAVGKTSMITKYVFATDTKSYHSTIGVDFFAQTAEIGGRTVNLHLWDTAGQERFRALIPNYTRDSFMAVILFDMTKRETFDKVDEWIDIFLQKNNNAYQNILLVGNKKDLFEAKPDSESVPISREEMKAKAEKYNAKFIETCSLTSDGIKELVMSIFEAVENSAVPDLVVPEFSIEAEPSRWWSCF